MKYKTKTKFKVSAMVVLALFFTWPTYGIYLVLVTLLAATRKLSVGWCYALPAALIVLALVALIAYAWRHTSKRWR
jgi:NADH:ubiquinone oxidoreductase subunit 3 (subunit A)